MGTRRQMVQSSKRIHLDSLVTLLSVNSGGAFREGSGSTV